MKAVRFQTEVAWEVQGDFAANAYSRAHVWRFDGGTEVPASASPHIVAPPASIAEAVDPEEAYLAALSSCHMLWFLDLARQAGWQVARYLDRAEGVLSRDADGRIWVPQVMLHIAVDFVCRTPERDAHDALHHAAHAACFIANSVKTEIAFKAAARLADG